jgi:hypothetical protein
MMRGEFGAVETSRKIAMPVLPLQCLASLIFRRARRAEVIVSSSQPTVTASDIRTERILFYLL